MFLKKCIIIPALLFIIYGCAETYKGFTEPTSENSMLVVGRVIVEDKGYTEKREVHKKGIRIAIYGVADNGKEIGVWARTDENGYFVLANVPKGEYAIKAVQLTVGTGQLITIENRLGSRNDSYIITNREFFVFEGGYFPFEPAGRIQSLKHHLFILDLSNRNILMVRNMALYLLENYELHSGEVLNAEPVERYFINKYPDSVWNKYLEESASFNKYPR